MIRKLLAVIFLVGLLPALAIAQQKTNFSGTWKLNIEKSDFGPIGGPTSRTDVIVQKDTSITVKVSAESPQGKVEYTANYATDGQETTWTVGDRPTTATAKWEANQLLVNLKFKFNDMDVTASATWSLSPDGKTLTITPHFVSSMGEADQKLVYDKQENAPGPAKSGE